MDPSRLGCQIALDAVVSRAIKVGIHIASIPHSQSRERKRERASKILVHRVVDDIVDALIDKTIRSRRRILVHLLIDKGIHNVIGRVGVGVVAAIVIRGAALLEIIFASDNLISTVTKRCHEPNLLPLPPKRNEKSRLR